MVTAFILATVKSGTDKSVIEKLRKMSEVREAANVYGDYDIVMKIEVKNLSDLDKLVHNKIRKLPEVVSTITMIGL